MSWCLERRSRWMNLLIKSVIWNDVNALWLRFFLYLSSWDLSGGCEKCCLPFGGGSDVSGLCKLLMLWNTDQKTDENRCFSLICLQSLRRADWGSMSEKLRLEELRWLEHSILDIIYFLKIEVFHASSTCTAIKI